MKLGVVYPQIEFAHRAPALRQIGLAIEGLGYDSILFYDHVVGAEHADREPPLWGPYTEADPFHDPFVATGYLAAITETVELATGVLILPQRQTVLVAQQAADVQNLSGGRLRIGVGTGWNHVEYTALGQDFATRGARIDEQIPLLRRLWEEPLVTFEGRFDRIERGCINPRPDRAIPIWIGGFGEPAFRRAARSGNGFSFAGNVAKAVGALARVNELLAAEGRAGEPFGRELILTRARTAAEVADTAAAWKAAGGDGVSVVTMRLGLDSVQAQLDHIAACKQALDAAVGS